MAELKFTTAGNGAQCVMIPGISMMPTWRAVSLVSPAHPPSPVAHVTVAVLVLFGWMPIVKEESLRSFLVPHMGDLEYLTVLITRTQVWFAILN